MVSMNGIILIMDKYGIDQLLLSPQFHRLKNGSWTRFIELFPDLDPLKIMENLSIFYPFTGQARKLTEHENIIRNLAVQNDRLKYVRLIYTPTKDIPVLRQSNTEDY